jgi:hypothetical protein
MSVDDGHGQGGHDLVRLLEGMTGDAEGVWRDADGNQINDTPISREGNHAYVQGEERRAAVAHDDAMRLIEHLRYNDSLFEHKRQMLRDGPDEAVIEEVANNPLAFLQGYDAVSQNLEADERNAPRNYQLENLREALKEHDEEYGPRSTATRERILRQIASLHGGR